MSIGLILAVISSVILIINFLKDQKKTAKDETITLQEIKTNGIKANMKLDDQCGRIQDLQVEVKTIKADFEKVHEKQIQHDIEIKAIWKNIDKLNEKADQ